MPFFSSTSPEICSAVLQFGLFIPNINYFVYKSTVCKASASGDVDINENWMKQLLSIFKRGQPYVYQRRIHPALLDSGDTVLTFKQQILDIELTWRRTILKSFKFCGSMVQVLHILC